eukprot:TRINITY_DN15942_c0_g1_i1.p1 TRINITY_DN15942_c0_g1~~TRINITY_DN15942_c0_g1_i1.p1  ORF type:complete len:710 (+),score=119.51 TRINITY_DN15942_c0_g1_i1:40-2169(+)
MASGGTLLVGGETHVTASATRHAADQAAGGAIRVTGDNCGGTPPPRHAQTIVAAIAPAANTPPRPTWPHGVTRQKFAAAEQSLVSAATSAAPPHTSCSAREAVPRKGHVRAMARLFWASHGLSLAKSKSTPSLVSVVATAAGGSVVAEAAAAAVTPRSTTAEAVMSPSLPGKREECSPPFAEALHLLADVPPVEKMPSCWSEVASCCTDVGGASGGYGGITAGGHTNRGHQSGFLRMPKVFAPRSRARSLSLPPSERDEAEAEAEACLQSALLGGRLRFGTLPVVRPPRVSFASEPEVVPITSRLSPRTPSTDSIGSLLGLESPVTTPAALPVAGATDRASTAAEGGPAAAKQTPPHGSCAGAYITGQPRNCTGVRRLDASMVGAMRVATAEPATVFTMPTPIPMTPPLPTTPPISRLPQPQFAAIAAAVPRQTQRAQPIAATVQGIVKLPNIAAPLARIRGLLDPLRPSSLQAQDAAAMHGLPEVAVDAMRALRANKGCSEGRDAVQAIICQLLLVVADMAWLHAIAAQSLVIVGVVDEIGMLLRCNQASGALIQRCCLLALRGLASGAPPSLLRAAAANAGICEALGGSPPQPSRGVGKADCSAIDGVNRSSGQLRLDRDRLFRGLGHRVLRLLSPCGEDDDFFSGAVEGPGEGAIQAIGDAVATVESSDDDTQEDIEMIDHFYIGSDSDSEFCMEDEDQIMRGLGA